MKISAGAVSLLLCFLAASTTIANVSIRNGNFFIGYTDIIFPGGMEMKVERVYNSKSPFLGIFGWGWGSDYEVYGIHNPDGSLTMHESGGGATNVFEPESFDLTAKTRAIDTICQVIMRVKPKTPEDLLEYKQRLFNNREFFLEEWEELIKIKAINPFLPAPGTRLRSKRFGYEEITRTVDGYRRVKNDQTSFFDNQGRLVEIRGKYGSFMKLFYDESGKLGSMVDNQNNRLQFYYTKNGQVDTIRTGGAWGKTCVYRYNDRKELIHSRDVDGNSYDFAYDGNGRHNLTKIAYTDTTTMEITYYDKDIAENVRSVKDRDGTVTRYAYDGRQLNEQESTLQVTINVFEADSSSISTSVYFYHFKRLSNGGEYTYRMKAAIDGTETDTYYEESGSPSLIIRGNDSTKFKYNAKGNLIYKETRDEIKKLEYSPLCLKVSRVERKNKHRRQPGGWWAFEYNDACSLVKAASADGTTCTLRYNDKGQIVEMLNAAGKKITLEYNEADKPTKITSDELGSITVKYTDDGAVKSVDSDGGRKVALLVTTAFQELLELLRPAEVTISF